MLKPFDTIDPQARAERAADLFLQGYNCCQSVVLAFADLLPLGELELKSLASGFGGGFGRMREVCGCVSGMTLLAGFISPADDPTDIPARTANYALVQKFAAAFRTSQGSIICREILGLRSEAKKSPESPQPSERTPHYYASRPCAGSCALAAQIVAAHLAEQGGRD